jgi:endogenous inhibitor of DNA gyrase (YacG/DUF329 family)
MIVKCPRCGKSVETTGNPFRPFCSERCKLIDLGNWISGTYRIPDDQPVETGADESDSGEDLNKK